MNKIHSRLMDEDKWAAIGEGAIKIILILILTGILIKIGKAAIHKTFEIRMKMPLRVKERREATLVKLLDNILSYVIYFIALMMILTELTIDVKAMLAGAGIVGLAVGFGAQNLVKDVISGFFIIFEDQFSVGDHIKIDQFEGTVDSIGLRTTKIKTWTGEVHILPNGSITQVTNYSLNNSMAVVDVGIAYEEDIEKAEQVIREIIENIPLDNEDIVSPPEFVGIQNFGPTEITVRVVAETKPMTHYGIARMLRKEIKLGLDEHGIDVPFPRVVMYSRENKDGKVNDKGEN
ncbi:mechanosensitive ion channel family protein [Neobacillus notoginsengisoli]|uniref:Mechanosensitive ion channel family protein n=1 Tax=Neobacillus notoginsengisoli TaxID=1578198 RepID=A0A417YTR8_9BACI|nr:mechanosensitive ion channel family protein [Neobacillus notoginsengisoli]RHW40452.1 mechanosensitive ion channel family protein [Neobacillus notoginsengisoli]